MVYKKDICGKFVTLRSITVEDAEFSYNLREKSGFLEIMGQPAGSVDNQRKFIEWQNKEKGDYYFVVYNKKEEKIGLIGVYRIDGDSAETGREINIGTPYETMETELLLIDFCTEVLKLKRVTGIIYKNNLKQINMYKRRGGYKISEIEHNGIPAFLLESTFEEQKKRMKTIRAAINKIPLR